MPLRWNPDYHTVKAGDTLYSIAMQYNLDTRTLIKWNDLGSEGRIRTGQKLRLSPPSGERHAAVAADTAVGAAARYCCPRPRGCGLFPDP